MCMHAHDWSARRRRHVILSLGRDIRGDFRGVQFEFMTFRHSLTHSLTCPNMVSAFKQAKFLARRGVSVLLCYLVLCPHGQNGEF